MSSILIVRSGKHSITADRVDPVTKRIFGFRLNKGRHSTDYTTYLSAENKYKRNIEEEKRLQQKFRK